MYSEWHDEFQRILFARKCIRVDTQREKIEEEERRRRRKYKNVKEMMINFITRTSKIWRRRRHYHCTNKRACLVAVTDETCDMKKRKGKREKCKVSRFIIVYTNLTFTNLFGRYSMRRMWMTSQSMISIIVKLLHRTSDCGTLTLFFYFNLLRFLFCIPKSLQIWCKISLQFSTLNLDTRTNPQSSSSYFSSLQFITPMHNVLKSRDSRVFFCIIT